MVIGRVDHRLGGMTGSARHMRRIAIVGAGQLGRRYLEGLGAVHDSLEVHVVDPSVGSLARAAEVSTGHQVLTHQDPSGCPDWVDLAVIATTADVRAVAMEEFAAATQTGFWIIEKVLGQGRQDLDQINAVTIDSSGAWVNMWNRMTLWYQRIREVSHVSGPTRFEATGGSWGMGCNGIHLLDFCQWWTGETLVEVDVAGLGGRWWPAKRDGFFEPSGQLVASFSGGSVITMSVDAPRREHGIYSLAGYDDLSQLSFEGLAGRWEIRQPWSEEVGRAVGPAGDALEGRIEFQSQRTPRLVNEILTEGTCPLPTLAEAAALHRPFLDAMISHWQGSTGQDCNRVPIT
ncbi:uncharacterized protein METZ01_LOCUS180280 [marine metagenome]|uniref:Gfo/Idh/MocA-like oxidoreductase N-terminal domain-containing protein n=1 Tax=marine metagenome TaxID=408172 RepID=A0A382CMS2_9ZZZZ